jgi:3-hydroxyacyl-[acyl-carrier-protein] dehydratase
VARTIWKYAGKATVDGQLAAEAELMCTLREIDPSAGGGTP